MTTRKELAERLHTMRARMELNSRQPIPSSLACRDASELVAQAAAALLDADAEIERLNIANSAIALANWKLNTQRAYGYLWPVNTRDRRVHAARKQLYSILTDDERGEGIQIIMQEEANS